MSVFNVATAAQLTTALSQVVGGDTIRLAAGNYGAISINNLNPTDLVTIESASALTPGHIDTMGINGSSNLAFRGLDIGRGLAAGEGEFTYMINVNGGSRIIFDRVTVHGSFDNVQNDGFGLTGSGVKGLVITDSVFTNLSKAMVIQQSDNLLVKKNSFLELRSDGINMSANHKVVIDGNLFKTFLPLPDDHPDAIQFFNVNQQRGSSDITIKNNVLLPGGTGPQGIFMSDAGHGYFNVTIENNVLWSTGQYHGIFVGGVKGVKIAGNTIVSSATDNKQFWISLHTADDIQISNNVSDNLVIQEAVTGLRQTDNTFFNAEPLARSLLRNLETPTSVDDLIIAGRGYQRPTAPDAAPVSDAIGGGLASMLRQLVGQTASKTDAPTIDEAISLDLNADAASSAPVSDLLAAKLSQGFAISEPTSASFTDTYGMGIQAFDHFVAHP